VRWAAALLLLGGCAATPPLPGTAWQLVERRAEGEVARPDDPSRYILTFGADGLVRLRLDCNGAYASAQATPTAPDRGTLAFSGLLVTAAMCPLPLDWQLARDLPAVRSYMVAGEELALASLPVSEAPFWTGPDGPVLLLWRRAR
jgi:hypothetical protein